MPVSGETVRNDFDSDALMRPPGFFDFVVLGSAPAKWLVLTDPNPPSVPYRLVQVEARRPDDAIAIAVRRNYAFEDGSVTTYVKRGGSRAGLVLRMAGERTSSRSWSTPGPERPGCFRFAAVRRRSSGARKPSSTGTGKSSASWLRVRL